jgi:hypothetical protein
MRPRAPLYRKDPVAVFHTFAAIAEAVKRVLLKHM